MDSYLLMMLLGILVITILLYIVIKDLAKVFDLSSKITLLSGVLLVILGYLIRYLILNNVSVINLNKASNVVVNKFLITSIYLIGISIFEQLVSKIIKKKSYIN